MNLNLFDFRCLGRELVLFGGQLLVEVFDLVASGLVLGDHLGIGLVGQVGPRFRLLSVRF